MKWADVKPGRFNMLLWAIVIAIMAIPVGKSMAIPDQVPRPASGWMWSPCQYNINKWWCDATRS